MCSAKNVSVKFIQCNNAPYHGTIAGEIRRGNVSSSPYTAQIWRHLASCLRELSEPTKNNLFDSIEKVQAATRKALHSIPEPTTRKVPTSARRAELFSHAGGIYFEDY